MRRFWYSFSFSPKFYYNLNITRKNIFSLFLNPTNYWAHHHHTHSMVPTTTNNILHHHQNHQSLHRRQQKIVVIMGATGSGKSKLSIDLATRFFPSEIINSDKIQMYRGLDITTNKMPMHERKGVPHHHLGEFQPTESTPEFTSSAFRSLAAETISQIISRRKVPLVVGGSNSFIYALLSRRFNPEVDVFSESNSVDSVCKQLRYRCCFIWVDVALPVLNEYLEKRVDDMLDSGMFEELAEFFAPEARDSVSQSGLLQAIGVPEFEKYFKKFNKGRTISKDGAEVATYEEAVTKIKENTCRLAKRQLEKIQRLRDAGWDLLKVDATEAFRAAMDRNKKVIDNNTTNNKKNGGGVTSDAGRVTSSPDAIWERQVVEPSVKIVKQFLME